MSQTACVQNSGEAYSCYSEKLLDTTDVFTGMLKKPHFKGGHDSLVSFLLTNIDLKEFADNYSQNKMAYTDTARLKFIVNKGGGIRALSITKAKNKKIHRCSNKSYEKIIL